NVLAGDSSGYTYNEIYYKTKGFWSSKTTHRIKEASWTAGVASTFTGDTTMVMAGRDVNVVGSNVGAQNDLVISGERNVNIVAGENTSANYDYEYIKKSGFGAMGGLSYGTRKQTDILDGTKVFHTASTVGSVQGDTLINAGKSLNVVGSNVLARQGDVTMIGRDVSIVAVADTAREKEYHEVKQSGFSINASTPIVSAMQTAGRMGEA
ncbi:hemagglutinin repeat-containing protein, partial [Achromobacter dolens]